MKIFSAVWISLIVCAGGLSQKGKREDRAPYASSAIDVPISIKDPVDIEQDVESESKRIAGEVAEAIRTLKSTQTNDVKRGLNRFITYMMDTFAPGVKPQPYSGIWSAIFIFISMTWFTIYFNFIYRPDSKENLDEATESQIKESAIALSGEKGSLPDVPVPDVILVFHHPLFDYKDQYRQISKDQVQNVLVDPDLSLEQSAFQQVSSLRPGLGHAHRFTHHLSLMTKGILPTAKHDHPDALTMREARVALLQDLFNDLPGKDFDVSIFSSIDNDELFMCLTLQKDKISHLLSLNSASLRIQSYIVEQLGINLPNTHPECSAPPYLRYDPNTVHGLKQAEVITANDDRLLYRTYIGRDPEGTIVNSMERITLILRDLFKVIDLDTAQDRGLLVKWYPVHGYTFVRKLSSWGSLRVSCGSLQNLFAQPADTLREYLGTRTAFNFVFHGHYCKALLALIPLWLLYEIGYFAARLIFNVQNVQTKMFLVFGVVIITWARIALNLWDREERFLLHLWNLHDQDQAPDLLPTFRGEYQESEVDTNIREKQTSKSIWYSPKIRRTLSWLVTMLCSVVACAFICSYFALFRGELNLGQSIVLSLIIKLFDIMYFHIVDKLTYFENHKYDENYYNSYVFKECMFQSMTNYSAYIYGAMVHERCHSADCLESLRRQLVIVQLSLSFLSVVEVCMSAFLVEVSGFLEDWQYKRSHNGDPPPSRVFAEAQSKFMHYRQREQVHSMLSIVISLGFILLFGAVSPILVPLCFGVFALRLKAQQYVLLHYTVRPVPRPSLGIGYWRTIIVWQMRFGIIFTGFLLSAFGEPLQGTPLITRMSAVTIFFFACLVVWQTIDILVKPDSAAVPILMARRRHVLETIAHKIEQHRWHRTKTNSSKDTKLQSSRKTGDNINQAVQDGRWEDILRYCEQYPPTP